MAKRGPVNPFYPLLIAAGIAFAVTACAYGVLTVRSLHGASSSLAADSQEGFSAVVDEHGMTAMTIELIALALFSLAAMATDQYWTSRERVTADDADKSG